MLLRAPVMVVRKMIVITSVRLYYYKKSKRESNKINSTAEDTCFYMAQLYVHRIGRDHTQYKCIECLFTEAE